MIKVSSAWKATAFQALYTYYNQRVYPQSYELILI